MRLDGARVQAGAAELSGSRCPGSCQRLGAGEEPADGDGDAVAEKGGELGACRSRRLMRGATAPSAGWGEEKCSGAKAMELGADMQEVWIGAAGTPSLRNVLIGKELGLGEKTWVAGAAAD